MGDEAELLTPEQAATLLKVHKGTLAAWRSRDKDGPPFLRVGFQIRYRREDLDKWLESRSSGANGA